MSTAQTTNAGRAENLERQMSLAEAIAANLGEGREKAEAQDKQDPEPQAQPEPEERQPVESIQTNDDATPEPEPEAESVGEQDAAPERTEGDEPEASVTYTLQDFAEAAETDVPSLLRALQVEVTGKHGSALTSLEDVISGYRFSAANTQRAQELAEQQKQASERMAEVSQMHDRAEAMIKHQWEGLDAAEQALDEQYRRTPWADLQAKGDGSYADTEARFERARRQIADQRKGLESSYDKVVSDRQDVAKKAQEEELPRQREMLLELVPEWRDETVANAEGEAIAKHFVERDGFSLEAIVQISDARIVNMLRRLWRYDTAVAGDAIAKKKVKAPSRTLKPGQQVTRQSANAEKLKKMRARLKNSGKATDLAGMVLHNLRSERKDGNGSL